MALALVTARTRAGLRLPATALAPVAGLGGLARVTVQARAELWLLATAPALATALTLVTVLGCVVLGGKMPGGPVPVPG